MAFLAHIADKVVVSTSSRTYTISARMLTIVASALIYSLAFPSRFATLHVLLAVALNYGAIRRSTPRQAFLLGVGWASMVAILTGSWIVAALPILHSDFRAIVPVLSALVVAFGAVLPFGLAMCITAAARPSVSGMVFGVAWMLAELIREAVCPLMLWASVKLAIVAAPAFREVVHHSPSIGGWILVTTGASLYFALTAGPLRFIFGSLILALLSPFLVEPRPEQPSSESLTSTSLAVVSCPVGGPSSYTQACLQRPLTMGVPHTVAWPESALDPETARWLLGSVSKQFTSTLFLAGSVERVTSDSRISIRPVVLAILNGRIIGRTYKQALVPYFESGSFRWPRGSNVKLERGGTVAPIPWRGQHIAAVLCSDVFDARLIGQLKRAGATIVLVLANEERVPYRSKWMLLRVAQLRAIEFRIPVVRGGWASLGCAIDEGGGLSSTLVDGVTRRDSTHRHTPSSASGRSFLLAFACLIANLLPLASSPIGEQQ